MMHGNINIKKYCKF